MSEPEQWLTISEAAKALGKPERTVRRWVTRLPPEALRDRPNVARRVRLSALIEMRDGHTATDDRSMADTGRPEESALVRALQEEIAFLRKQVEAGNTAQGELRRLMLADRQELQELRQRVALLLPPAPSPETPDELTAPGSPEPVSGTEEARGVQIDTPRSETTKRRAWWQIWKR
jgi:hypothetical protein